ncbi:zinc-binding alcohol dehydrogenase family protein [Oxalobacteraceae bacterium OM1]|nr:zinc-binding alcohol dehydrogenase family protein [Oxalobacteraceae bacterium OM1]
MRAMVLPAGGGPLQAMRLPVPEPGPDDVLLQVAACGVCRTDLHIVDGELPPHRRPVVPGHQIVGRVVARGSRVTSLAEGDRVGVPWLGGTCGHCTYCTRTQENLCDRAVFTGYDRDGGYADYVAADARYCCPLPARYDDLHAAPLLCAGLIGYRAYAMKGDAETIGLYGFGAAAHIIAQVARHAGRRVFAFTRPGDVTAQAFARSLGAEWAGDSTQAPPTMLDAAIIFAADGALVPIALKAVRKGGSVVCAGIHMSDIPGFAYDDLWGERVIRSVANLTRADSSSFFRVAEQCEIKTSPVPFPLAQANEALGALRSGAFTGAAVLLP